jgi:S1-C subfamily serine protease
MPGFDADDEGGRPPPHPLDRPWIHPSELGGPRRRGRGDAERARPPGRSWRHDAVLALTAGAVGALATVVALALAGAFDTETARPLRDTSLPVSTDAAAVASRIAPGVAAVAATAASGAERRGSGIVVGPHELLTTTPVVAGVDAGGTIRVSWTPGRQHVARVRASDPVTGLSLLAVDGMRMQPARLGATDTVRAGDWVVAVGRTATNGPWVTSGVVTATGGWTQDADGIAHPGLIATSTEVVDDARGGALVDARGHIVGILSMTGSPRAAAMPADVAGDVASQLTEHGRATHGALGIAARDEVAGPTVQSVTAGSAADHAGIRTGDRILAVDTTPTQDTATLVDELRRRRAGARTEITVQRGKQRRTLTATLDDTESTVTASPTVGTAPLSLAVTGSG